MSRSHVRLFLYGIWSALFFITPGAVFAQSNSGIVQGTVTDASSQAGIAGATVSVCVPNYGLMLFGTCASPISTTGGQYTIDSSSFLEAAVPRRATVASKPPRTSTCRRFRAPQIPPSPARPLAVPLAISKLP